MALEDKIVHSAVGLGAIITAISALLFWSVGMVYLVVLVPIILAFAKEIYDYLRYKRFDKKDLFATLNPSVVLRWYRDIIK